MATTSVEVVSPDRTLYSGEVEMVATRTVDGEIAFLANHTPLIGALAPGVLRLVGVDGGTNELAFAVAGGFVEVSDNKVIVLADRARSADDVDVQAARADLTAAEERLRAHPDDEQAEADQRYAEALLEVAGSPRS
jgi:F-type H+-transporting ATPase subunit epsilon